MSFGRLRRVLEERVRPPEGPREPQEPEKRDFGRLWTVPSQAKNASDTTYTVLSAMVTKNVKNRVFFVNCALWVSKGGPGRVPRGAFGALARNQEALGKVNQVQGGPFLRVLDWQKLARAPILR